MDDAERLMREALQISRESGYRSDIVWGLDGLAWVLRQQGMFAEALTLLEEAIAISQNEGYDSRYGK